MRLIGEELRRQLFTINTHRKDVILMHTRIDLAMPDKPAPQLVEVASFSEEDISMLNEVDAQFLVDSRRATTDAPVRVRRTKYLVDLMSNRQQSFLIH